MLRCRYSQPVITFLNNPKDGGTTLFRNVCIYIPIYKASHCRRLESSVIVIFISWPLALHGFTPNKTFPPQAWILSLLPHWHRLVRYVKTTNGGTKKTKKKKSKVYDCSCYTGILSDSTSPVSPKSSQSDAKYKCSTPFIATCPVAWNILQEISFSQT